MVLKRTTFEGLSDGQAIPASTGGTNTALASGSGDVPTQVGKGTGSNIVGVASPAAFGTRAARFDLAAGQATFFTFAGTGSGASDSICIYLFAYPTDATNTWEILRIAGSSGRLADARIDTAGKMRIYNGAATLCWTAAAAVPLNQWVRYDLYAKEGTGTTDGIIKGGYATTTTAALATYTTGTIPVTGGTSFSTTVTNTGTLAPVTLLGGKVNSTSTWGPTNAFVADNWSGDFGVTDVLTPPTPDSAPTATLGASDQYPEAGSGVTVTLTAGGTGTIASRVYSVQEQPAGSATPSFATPTASTTTVTIPTYGQYLFGVVNTGPGGSSTMATVRVYAHAAAGVDEVMVSESGASLWTNQGTATSQLAAVNDNSALTASESPVNPTGQVKRWQLPPLGLGPIEVDTSAYSDGGTITSLVYTLYKEDGTTAVDSFEAGPLVLNTDTQTVFTVDNAGLALITTLASRRAMFLDQAATA